jgi:hypothetical protein
MLVLVTVTGITLHTDLSVSNLVVIAVLVVLTVSSSLMALDLAAESLLADLTQDQTLVHLTTNVHLLLLMAVVSMKSNVLSQLSTLKKVLVTVTGIILHTEVLVPRLAEKSVRIVLDAKNSLMVIDLAAESPLVDLIQDQTLVHLTTNAHLPQLTVEKSIESNSQKC